LNNDTIKEKRESGKVASGIFNARTFSQINFFILLFVMFFGTSMPFADRTKDISDIATSNIVNQLVYVYLFLVSILCIIPNYKRIQAFISREKFLFMFLAWCFFSVFWSDYTLISFKRYFRLITEIIVILNVLLIADDDEKLLKHFLIILFLYSIISILSIVAIPAAKDPKFAGAWRGLTHHKNELGQVAVFSFLLAIWLLQNEKKLLARIAIIIILVLSVLFIVMSGSSTSIITFSLLIFISAFFLIDKLFEPLDIGGFLSTTILSISFGLLLYFVFFNVEALAFIPELVGKDFTFTGRADLWEDIWIECQKHLFLGSGFAGFWIIDSANLTELYELYTWLPNEAHNGYIDILNEVGIIGIVLLMIIIVSLFRKTNLWTIILISLLLFNVLESTLFRQGMMASFMFNFSYLFITKKYFTANQKKLT